MKIQLVIRHMSSDTNIEISNTETLSHLKDKIFSIFNILPEYQILICNDRLLTDNNKSLVEIDLKDKSIIQLKKRIVVKGGQKQGMDLLLKSSDMMNILPKIQEGLKDNNELKSMMSNPDFMEEMANMSKDPNYMKTQMKNFDLQISRMENLPGGFNTINSLMKDVQDPLSSILESTNIYKEGEHITSKISDPLPYKDNKINWLLKYREELAILRGMGFPNARNNLSTLVTFKGDVQAAMQHLSNNK